MASLQRFCDAMRWAAESDQVGYSQSDRDSLGPDDFFGDGLYNTDCSKLTIVAAQYAGFDTAWASYTGNMSDAFTACGWSRLPVTGDLMAGDILLNDGNHVGVWVGDCIAQASIDENGNIAGGARGDQTGWEVNLTGWYNYPWNCILRWEGPQDEDTPSVREDDKVKQVINDGGEVHRLYNPNGMHHYTASEEERSSLVDLGWVDEGVVFTSRANQNHAVYRMFNPNNGDHLLTTDFWEAQSLGDAGWLYEGVPFFASDDGQEVFRVYNPNSGEHLFTSDSSEVASLSSIGWENEGTAFRM